MLFSYLLAKSQRQPTSSLTKELSVPLIYPSKPSQHITFKSKMRRIPMSNIILLLMKEPISWRLWPTTELLRIRLEFVSTTRSIIQLDMMNKVKAFILRKYIFFNSGTRRSLYCQDKQIYHHWYIQCPTQNAKRS